MPFEGITKTQHLRQRLDAQSVELERGNAMISLFRNASDTVATEALARLRMGESIESVLHLLGPEHAVKGSEQIMPLSPWIGDSSDLRPFVTHDNGFFKME